MSGECIQETFLTVVSFTPQIAYNVADMPGSITQRIIFSPETIRLAPTGIWHVVSSKKLACLLTLDFRVPIRAAENIVTLLKAVKIFVYVETRLFVY